MMEEFVRNKNKERLLVEAKALRRYMILGESAALLIREDRDVRAQLMLQE